jgi:predicted nucleic acid-binding protein
LATRQSAVRVAFDTTVLWGAFLGPAGANFRLLALAAQRTPVLDAFITDAVGAEFWWRATQQGVKRSGERTPRTFSAEEIELFLEAFGVLFEPAALEQAPLSRSLGRHAGLVGTQLGEMLHIITGRDRAALMTAPSLSFPATFESIDIADLHVIAGAVENGAHILCTSDRRTLKLDPIGSLRVLAPDDLAAELGLIDSDAPSAAVTRASDI